MTTLAQYKKAIGGFIASLVPLGGALLSLGVLSGPASHDLAVALAIATPVVAFLGVAIAPANVSPGAASVAVTVPLGATTSTASLAPTVVPVVDDLVTRLEQLRASYDATVRQWDAVRRALEPAGQVVGGTVIVPNGPENSAVSAVAVSPPSVT